jgi:hypothetical protein
MMSMSLRLSVGKGEDFITYSLTLSSIVALIAGGLAVTNVSTSFFNTGVPSSFEVLVQSLSKELRNLLIAWMVPIIVLLVASSFTLALRSGQLFFQTASVLLYTGSTKQKIRSLLLMRLLLLSLTSWLFGWVGGVVASQMAFRFVSLATGSPFLIPFLYPSDLVILAIITTGSVFAGYFVSVIRLGRSTEEVTAF